jgi:glycosyltransferase involved in cell wall biosynthesis
MSGPQRRPRVLVVFDHYLPGENAGGPVRSIANLVAHLGNEFEFLVVTKNRDLGAEAPYAGLDGKNAWVPVHGALVRYLPAAQWLSMLIATVRSTPHDLLYLNSYFAPSSQALLAARRAGVLQGTTPVVIAPRGQFGDSALAMKSSKKRLCLAAANALGLHAGVQWHATTPTEAEAIGTLIRPAGEIALAANLTAPQSHISVAGEMTSGDAHPSAPAVGPKRPGSLHIATVARINRMKNQAWAIERLASLEGNVIFDLYGPLEDPAYLTECRVVTARLGAHIQVRFPGPLSQRQVAATLERYHLFFLPTLGENFAHAVHEALAAGCPVLLSDRTPWRGLRGTGAGWDLSLDTPMRFETALAECLATDAAGQAQASLAARTHAIREAARRNAPALATYRTLFHPSHAH